MRITIFLVLINFSWKLTAQRAPVQLLEISSMHNESQIIIQEYVVNSLFLHPELKNREAVVISIVGAFRKGKSFLMNYMLRYLYAKFTTLSNSDYVDIDTATLENDDWLGNPNDPLTGFEWKSGVERTTRGIIMWNDIFLHNAPNGEKYAIYIIDTQGLFDYQTTVAENSKIFSLTTLISSIQILNIFNIIQEDQLQYLQFATEYAHYANSDSSSQSFQDLLILIRDWNSVNDYEYGLNGGNAYLNNFLKIHDHQSRELQSVRRYLRSSFEKIDCFLMPYPGKVVAVDKSYDGRWISIDDDFVTYMKDLFNYLFQDLKPKKINGKPVEPDELLIFIKSYVESFKNDTIPKPVSIYESTLEKQFEILMAQSFDIYINTIGSHDSELSSENDINRLHSTAKEKALKNFNAQKTFGQYSDGQKYKKELTETIEKGFKQWSSVTLNQIKKLKEQKALRVAQEKKLQNAQSQNNEARQEVFEKDAKLTKAREDLYKAQADAQKTREEIQSLKKELADAQKKRDEATENERKSRESLEKSRNEKEFYETEYQKLRQNSAASIGRQLENIQNRDGFEHLFELGKKVYSTFKDIYNSVKIWLAEFDE